MHADDRSFYRMTTAADYGVASLTMASVVLGWSVAVQYALLALLVLVTGLERAAVRRRR